MFTNGLKEQSVKAVKNKGAKKQAAKNGKDDFFKHVQSPRR
jgi:hypothetical protein